MFNQDEIKIAQIKDLRLLYIYNCEESLNDFDNPYFGLRIVYDNDKKLSYSYKDEYFNQFLSKVIEVYNKEKELGNVRFLDDRTQKIFEEIDKFPKVKIQSDLGNVQNAKMSGFNSRRMELGLIKPYVKDLIIKFLWAVKQDENVRIISIDGNNNKFICQYMIKNKNFVIPMIITKSSYDHFKIKFSYTKGNVINMNGSINIRPNSIVSEWIDKDKVLTGKNIYHVKADNFEKYVMTPKGILFYDNNVPQVEQKDTDLVNRFLELLKLNKIENIRKTVDNCYILTGEEQVEENSELFLKNALYASFDTNMADIIYKKNYGVKKANNQFFITLDEEIISITIKLEKIDDNNVLIVQKSFLPSVNSNGQYKKDLVDNYSYEIYTIDGDNLLEPFKILKNIEFSGELKGVEQIKTNLLRYKGGNYGVISNKKRQ